MVKRVIKNGTSYSNEFLQSVRDQVGADTMISDNAGNILICTKTIDYVLDPSDNTWKAEKPHQDEGSHEKTDSGDDVDTAESLDTDVDANSTEESTTNEQQ